ncbi:MAG: 4-hydroxy-tetrahydrodipicolinate reductase [Parvibaculaceae bacterium]
MPLRICVAGVTGTLGSGVARAIMDSADLKLVSAVSRKAAGQDVGEAIGRSKIGVRIESSLEHALRVPTDVLIDYTGPESIKRHTTLALQSGMHVVIGATGLVAEDYEVLDAIARRHNVGAVTGVFSLIDALWQRFALEAAEQLHAWEIIDYADARKADSPSGTARELADRLAKTPKLVRPPDQTLGAIEARGANVSGSQIHSIRMPGYVFACEVIFGTPEERMILRIEQTSQSTCFVEGTLMATRRVGQITGLVRGFDRLLFATDGQNEAAARSALPVR